MEPGGWRRKQDVACGWQKCRQYERLRDLNTILGLHHNTYNKYYCVVYIVSPTSQSLVRKQTRRAERAGKPVKVNHTPNAQRDEPTRDPTDWVCIVPSSEVLAHASPTFICCCFSSPATPGLQSRSRITHHRRGMSWESSWMRQRLFIRYIGCRMERPHRKTERHQHCHCTLPVYFIQHGSAK